jgi:hypothetical protein
VAPFVTSRFTEASAQFSPDIRWVAYSSDETGRPEVYVAPFGRSGARVPISTQGGASPRWRPDGKELFYIRGDNTLVGVDLRADERAIEGRAAHVRDSKGMHYLSRLLAEPGREFHVLDLVALERAPDHAGTADPTIAFLAAGDAGELLDARAKAAYRRRLAEIDEDLTEAEAIGDAARAAQTEVERDILVRELSRAVGLRGRDRRAGSDSERGRSAVTRAMCHALARIRKHHAPLGDYLDRTIRTGSCCVYLPDPRFPTAWKI